MHVRKQTITLTTSGAGAATGYSELFTGEIDRIIYTKTDFADGVDFAITLESTGESIWTEANVNAAKAVAPRQATHDTAGGAALYAGGGAAVRDRIPVFQDRIVIAVTNGGDTKVGAFTIVLR